LCYSKEIILKVSSACFSRNHRKRPTPDGDVEVFDIPLEVQIDGLPSMGRWVTVLPLTEEDFLIGMDIISMGRMVINDKRSFFFECPPKGNDINIELT
jgi:hypothetical protein